MTRMKKAALLTRLIEALRSRDSWCGETHIQKAVYCARHLANLPMEYDFILYKHGPFSFDLRDELTALRADGLLTLEIQGTYGPRIAPTEQSGYIQSFYPKTLEKYRGGIEFVADEFGNKGVVDLERLATALYVCVHGERAAAVQERAERMVELKPHIPLKDARDAVEEIVRTAGEAADRGFDVPAALS